MRTFIEKVSSLFRYHRTVSRLNLYLRLKFSFSIQALEPKAESKPHPNTFQVSSTIYGRAASGDALCKQLIIKQGPGLDPTLIIDQGVYTKTRHLRTIFSTKRDGPGIPFTPTCRLFKEQVSRVHQERIRTLPGTAVISAKQRISSVRYAHSIDKN